MVRDAYTGWISPLLELSPLGQSPVPSSWIAASTRLMSVRPATLVALKIANFRFDGWA